MRYRRLIYMLSLFLCVVTVCACQSTKEENASVEPDIQNISDNIVDNSAKEIPKEGEKISVAIVGSPQDEILKRAEGYLTDKGYWIEQVLCTDVNACMDKLVSGQVDAVYGGHTQYLDIYNDKNNTEYISLGAVHFEPMVVYAKDEAGLENIADGAKIAIPNEEIRASRALFLLAQEGVITLRDDVGNMVTVADIIENPHNVTMEMIEEGAVLDSLEQCDFTVGSKNFVLLQEDYEAVTVCATENADSMGAQVYGCLLITSKEKETDEKIEVLKDVLHNNELQSHIETYFLGSVTPLE